MDADRIENAVQRIELALSRIANAADSPTDSGGGDDERDAIASVTAEHEDLREKVSKAIRELDDLIRELEA